MLQFYSAIRKVHFFYSNVLSLFLFNYYHMTWKTTTDDSAARRSTRDLSVRACPAKALSWRSACPSRAMERQAKARVCLCVVVGTRQDWSPAGRHCSSLSIALAFLVIWRRHGIALAGLLLLLHVETFRLCLVARLNRFHTVWVCLIALS